MRQIFHFCTFGAMLASWLVSWGAQAMMAPKYERVRALTAALDHLSEIAHVLEGPIDKIEYVGSEVRFSAGQCFVPVIVTYEAGRDAAGRPVLGGGDYQATVGKMQCR
jgi:hypothetical protein